jgi:tetratricopeptide repeat protein
VYQDVTENAASASQATLKQDEAEARLRRALVTSEQAFGPEHLDTMTHLDNLAVHCVGKGDYLAAEPLLRRVLDARERALGPEHPDTLTSVHNLAALSPRPGNAQPNARARASRYARQHEQPGPRAGEPRR